MTKTKFAASSALIALLLSRTALASDKDTQELRAEIEAMRQSYESRIADSEAKLSKVEKATANQAAVKQAPAVASKEENKQPEAVARALLCKYKNLSILAFLNQVGFDDVKEEVQGY
jgi:predicted component of type VI protein secretion system